MTLILSGSGTDMERMRGKSATSCPVEWASFASGVDITAHHRVFQVISQPVPGAIPKCSDRALDNSKLRYKNKFMARYRSHIEYSGSIDNLTFYKNDYGNQVKSKGSPSEHAMKHGENFKNPRLNAAEFARAGAASKLFHQAMGPVLAGVNNQRLSGRMIGWLHDVIKSDRIHDKGERIMSAGDFSGLAGFELNRDRELDDVIPLNTANHLCRKGGIVKVDIPAFRLRKKKSIPAGATHYRLVSCLLKIDFDKKQFTREVQQGPLCAMGRKAGAGFCVEQEVPSVDAQGCFWLVGISFYRLVDDDYKLVKGGAMRVVEWLSR